MNKKKNRGNKWDKGEVNYFWETLGIEATKIPQFPKNVLQWAKDTWQEPTKIDSQRDSSTISQRQRLLQNELRNKRGMAGVTTIEQRAGK